MSSYLLICFSFFLSDSFISIILSSISLILSSASVILLFVASRVFLISFIFLPCYVALCASKARHRLSSKSVSWCLETSLFLRLPSWDGTPSRDGAPSLPPLSLFSSFIFFLPVFEDNDLLFWVPDVFCQHSEVVW